MLVYTVVSQKFDSPEEKEDVMSAVKSIFFTHKLLALQWKAHNVDSRNIILAIHPTHCYI